MLWRSILIILVSGLVWWVTPAEAASCTKGTNCYCDKVQGGSLNDPQLIVCEDWEASTLHDNVGFGGGTPYYGPWYDGTGFASGGRGFNSYMAKTYPSSGAGLWRNPNPVSPTLGESCAFTDCWPAEYRLDNLWQGNNEACIDIIKTGSSNANDEGAELGIPDAPGTSDNRGAWDGQQAFGYRVQPNNGPCGILGTPSFTAVTEIGITMAVAYGDNTGSLNTISNCVGGQPCPIKHEEYGNSGASFNQETMMGNVGLNQVNGFPFAPAHFTTSQSACNTALAAATVSVGQADCTNAPALRIGVNASEYVQSTDWPFGKWGCVRAHKSGMGTSNVSLKIWYGNGLTEKLIFSMTNFNGAALANQSYNFFIWNSYMNANSPEGGYPGLDGKWRRWIDNVHIRNGVPVSCAQIGFGGGSVSRAGSSGGLRATGGVKF